MSTKPDTDQDLDDDVAVMDGQDEQDLGQPNPLEMSDEDFLKQGAPVVQTNQTTKPEAEEGGDDDNDEGDDKPVDEQPTKVEAKTDEGSGASKDPKAGEGDKTQKTVEDPKVDDKGKEKQEPADKTGDVDFAAAGKALLAPFKANGREVRVDTVEDARALMQMGANYNKKMAGLKPSLKILKLLENNDLLSEEKLGFLIDLSKKDTGAINKLVKDSGLNPMDLDPDKAGEYRPSAQKVDDREMELDTVLDDLKESTTYTQTLAIAQGWDAESKKVIADYPNVLRIISKHVEDGAYEVIKNEVERERTFGRLQGLSDIEAYRQVGDAIHARGGFNHLMKHDGADLGKSSEAGKVIEPKPKKADDDSRNDKRRALGTPRQAAPTGSVAKDFNPLAMSDEDFAKQAVPKFR